VTEAKVTVTVYACVDLSAAVTVYVLSEEKSALAPDAGLTLEPVMAIVGTSAVSDVSPETTTEIL
jgi:hypothetical protein